MRNILKNYGLNEKESEVYLAALELGEATGFQIYKKTTLKKPTVYYILNELQTRGMINQTQKAKKRYFVAADPEKIKKDLEEKLNVFSRLLPELRSLYNYKVSKPKLRFYEGKAGIKEVYKDTLCYKGEILAFASETLLRALGKEFSDEYIKKRIEAGIPVRAIMPSSDLMHKNYVRENLSQLRTIKLIDEKKYNFPIEINIYANRVALMSFRDELGLIIESDEMSKMLRMMFDYFWKTL